MGSALQKAERTMNNGVYYRAKVIIRDGTSLMADTIGTLVLVRHGQSQWNLENRFTGWVDIALTKEGEAEARRAGELLKGTTFDHAFTSALSRAQETLRIILETTGQTDVPIERDQALNERHY